MDDLVSRKSAIEFANEQKVKETGAYSKGRNDALNIMRSALNNPDAIPSVPAVPLDKLCEFLGKATQPCILLAIGCPYDESNCEECDPHDSWKAVLTKWMEAQDAR